MLGLVLLTTGPLWIMPRPASSSTAPERWFVTSSLSVFRRVFLATQAVCLLDPTCLASLTCPAGCTGGDAFVAGLCNYECGEAGTRSPSYMAMMLCWGTHRCQETRPQPAGPCAALTAWEGLKEITSLDLLEGSWRVVQAWNCQGSGITFASCQHWQLGTDINQISFSLASPAGPSYKQLRQQVSLPYPGVLRANYQQDNGAVGSPKCHL